MLRAGPPQIVIEGVPLRVKELLSVGWVTRIGVGDITLTMAAIAVAETVVEAGPNKCIIVVFTVRCTVTCIK